MYSSNEVRKARPFFRSPLKDSGVAAFGLSWRGAGVWIVCPMVEMSPELSEFVWELGEVFLGGVGGTSMLAVRRFNFCRMAFCVSSYSSIMLSNLQSRCSGFMKVQWV